MTPPPLLVWLMMIDSLVLVLYSILDVKRNGEFEAFHLAVVSAPVAAILFLLRDNTVVLLSAALLVIVSSIMVATHQLGELDVPVYVRLSLLFLKPSRMLGAVLVIGGMVALAYHILYYNIYLSRMLCRKGSMFSALQVVKKDYMGAPIVNEIIDVGPECVSAKIVFPGIPYLASFLIPAYMCIIYSLMGGS